MSWLAFPWHWKLLESCVESHITIYIYHTFIKHCMQYMWVTTFLRSFLFNNMNLLRQPTHLTPDLMFCHTGRIMSHWLCFIKWRVEEGCLLVPCCVHFFSPMSFVRWHVWSQRDFVSHRNELTCSHTTYSSLHGVLWHWTMSHLRPMFSVSVSPEQKQLALYHDCSDCSFSQTSHFCALTHCSFLCGGSALE